MGVYDAWYEKEEEKEKKEKKLEEIEKELKIMQKQCIEMYETVLRLIYEKD